MHRYKMEHLHEDEVLWNERVLPIKKRRFGDGVTVCEVTNGIGEETCEEDRIECSIGLMECGDKVSELRQTMKFNTSDEQIAALALITGFTNNDSAMRTNEIDSNSHATLSNSNNHVNQIESKSSSQPSSISEDIISTKSNEVSSKFHDNRSSLSSNDSSPVFENLVPLITIDPWDWIDKQVIMRDDNLKQHGKIISYTQESAVIETLNGTISANVHKLFLLSKHMTTESHDVIPMQPLSHDLSHEEESPPQKSHKKHATVTPESTHKHKPETPKLGEILASFQNNKLSSFELFGTKSDLLFGTAALERSRRVKKNVQRYEDTEMIQKKHSHKSEESAHSKRLLNSINANLWIGTHVRILAGTLKGCTGMVTTESKNGWVHVLLDSGTKHSGETSRRASELEILKKSSCKISQLRHCSPRHKHATNNASAVV